MLNLFLEDSDKNIRKISPTGIIVNSLNEDIKGLCVIKRTYQWMGKKSEVGEPLMYNNKELHGRKNNVVVVVFQQYCIVLCKEM